MWESDKYNFPLNNGSSARRKRTNYRALITIIILSFAMVSPLTLQVTQCTLSFSEIPHSKRSKAYYTLNGECVDYTYGAELEKTLVYEDSFENGVSAWWNEKYGTPTISTEVSHSGNCSYLTDEDYDVLLHWFDSTIVNETWEFEVWFYDSMSGDETSIIATQWAAHEVLGLLIWCGEDYDDFYAYRYGYVLPPTLSTHPRSIGWHRVNIIHEPQSASILLDGEFVVQINEQVAFNSFEIGDTWIYDTFSFTYYDSIKVWRYTPKTTPTISIQSPQNTSYGITSVPLSFTVNEPTSWIGYSLDGSANATIDSNTTLADLYDGLHSLVLYANDTLGNMGSSSITHFLVDTTGPNITNVTQTPPGQAITEGDNVEISVMISDYLSGVKQATLVYTYVNSSGGPWVEATSMAHPAGYTWNATIPACPQGTNITYAIIAEDNLGNTITTQELGYYYQYSVIPEFPPFLIVPLFMITTLLAVITCKKRTRRQFHKAYVLTSTTSTRAVEISRIGLGTSGDIAPSSS
jgi:hypothetical protein